MGLENQKRAAAFAALDYVKPGMRLGLGTGTSASQFVIALGERMRTGLEVVGVPTSAATEALARTHGVALTTLDRVPHLDLTVDGADEIDGSLRLIKGGGGALLREKIVAAASEVMIVIADSSKRVDTLGAFPLPVEIVPFGARATMRMIEAIAKDCGCEGEVLLRVKETEAVPDRERKPHLRLRLQRHRRTGAPGGRAFVDPRRGGTRAVHQPRLARHHRHAVRHQSPGSLNR